ncbi:MAG: HAD-IA family hydrolase [Rhodobacteraceae bacterium]|nr:HAD-IA family hydrolase [Paracoccaceae bacterium]
MTSLRALIFDVDGTLAETEEAHRQAFNAVFAAHGLAWNWSVEDYTALLRVTGGKERMKAHRDACGESLPDDATIARMHAEKTDAYVALVAGGGLQPRAGVASLMQAARDAGLKLAIATTTSPANVDALTRALWGRAATEMFDVIAAGDEVAAKKPAPDVYLLALQRLGLPPEQAIALEDSVNGVRSARAAGLRVVVTPSIFTVHEDHSAANLVVPDLTAVTLQGLADLT